MPPTRRSPIRCSPRSTPRVSRRCGACCARAARISPWSRRTSRPTIRPAARSGSRPTRSATGKHVENRIEAAFAFREGLIVHHVDTFDLWRWLRQALGAQGALFGWLPLVQRTVRAQAAKALADWRTRNPGVTFLAEPEWEHDQPRRVGVLLLNLGTPDAPTAKAVRRYLAEFRRTAASSRFRASSGSRSCTSSCFACGRRARPGNTR